MVGFILPHSWARQGRKRSPDRFHDIRKWVGKPNFGPFYQNLQKTSDSVQALLHVLVITLHLIFRIFSPLSGLDRLTNKLSIPRDHVDVGDLAC